MLLSRTSTQAVMCIFLLSSSVTPMHAAELTDEQRSTLQITLGWMIACEEAGSAYIRNVETLGNSLFGQDDSFWSKPIGAAIGEIIENNPETSKSQNFIADPINEKVMCEMYLAGINRGVLTERALRSAMESQ